MLAMQMYPPALSESTLPAVRVSVVAAVATGGADDVSRWTPALATACVGDAGSDCERSPAHHARTMRKKPTPHNISIRVATHAHAYSVHACACFL